MLSIVPKSAIPDLTEYIYDVIQHQIFLSMYTQKCFRGLDRQQHTLQNQC